MDLRDALAALGVVLMKAGAQLQRGKKGFVFREDATGWRFVAGSDTAAVWAEMEKVSRDARDN